MRIVVALGGNALLERGERPDAEIQRHHVHRAAASLAPLTAEHDLIICHGNGPQVGLLAMESEADSSLTHPYPLDVLVAQTQGMIGYWLAQELHNAGVGRLIASVVTQTVVRADDPAFAHPTKFIGANYSEQSAQALARHHGWVVARDGDSWRRVVPSPRPISVIEEATLRALVDTHAITICGGGGGAPVFQDGRGLRGVEAVVDKDHVAALLGLRFAADRLLVLTDVSAVMRDFGTPRQRSLSQATTAELAGMSFAAGSMGPKIEACIAFTTATQRSSAIGRLDDAASVLAGTAGTTIRTTPLTG
jgi:carbamate kinase